MDSGDDDELVMDKPEAKWQKTLNDIVEAGPSQARGESHKGKGKATKGAMDGAVMETSGDKGGTDISLWCIYIYYYLCYFLYACSELQCPDDIANSKAAQLGFLAGLLLHKHYQQLVLCLKAFPVSGIYSV
jgi:hypothetical protein